MAELENSKALSFEVLLAEREERQKIAGSGKFYEFPRELILRKKVVPLQEFIQDPDGKTTATSKLDAQGEPVMGVSVTVSMPKGSTYEGYSFTTTRPVFKASEFGVDENGKRVKIGEKEGYNAIKLYSEASYTIEKVPYKLREDGKREMNERGYPVPDWDKKETKTITGAELGEVLLSADKAIESQKRRSWCEVKKSDIVSLSVQPKTRYDETQLNDKGELGKYVPVIDEQTGKPVMENVAKIRIPEGTELAGFVLTLKNPHLYPAKLYVDGQEAGVDESKLRFSLQQVRSDGETRTYSLQKTPYVRDENGNVVMEKVNLNGNDITRSKLDWANTEHKSVNASQLQYAFGGGRETQMSQ
ncbi:MAG: hypothetical protein FWH17_06350 [Oscillospiraceae bacterium]|nr:hypothetical protein [Oscillospiraceae bacterium]